MISAKKQTKTKQKTTTAIKTNKNRRAESAGQCRQKMYNKNSLSL